MTSAGAWLVTAAIAAVSIVGLYLLRRYILKQSKEIAAMLDVCDYVIVEAAPEQLTELRTEFARSGWRSHESKPTSGRGVLSTFVRSSSQAPPLSEMLGVGGKPPRASAKKSKSDFQMKIKAHGPLSDLHA